MIPQVIKWIFVLQNIEFCEYVKQTSQQYLHHINVAQNMYNIKNKGTYMSAKLIPYIPRLFFL